MPSDDVERTVVSFVAKELAEELVNDGKLDVTVFVSGDGSEEVTRIGETISTNWAEIGDFEMSIVDFRDVTA